MRTLLSRAAIAFTTLALIGGGGLAWYLQFLDQLPSEFERPIDQTRSQANGQTVFVGGWGGGGGPITRTPVIFVHGTTGAAWNWGVARAYFRWRGYQPDELWALSYGWGGALHSDPNGVKTTDDAADENLADLDGFVRSVLAYVQARNPSIEQIDIVAHSMGGVIARKWLKQGDNSRHIRRLVTLDSPHHGIQEQWLRNERSQHGWSRFNQEFVYDSPWLKELNTPPEVPDGVKALAIYDGTGLVSFTATPLSPRIEGAENLPYNVDRNARITHVAYIYNPGVLRTVFDWLQSP